MATYNKPMKKFKATTYQGNVVEAFDSGNNRDGSYAIDAFEKRGIVKGTMNDNNEVYYAPFHSIMIAEYGISTEATAKGNPYGCEGGSDLDYKLWFTGAVGECRGDFKASELTKTDQADVASLTANLESYSVKANDTILQFAYAEQGVVVFSDTGSTEDYGVSFTIISDSENEFQIVCSSDITTAEVYVAHK